MTPICESLFGKPGSTKDQSQGLGNIMKKERLTAHRKSSLPTGFIASLRHCILVLSAICGITDIANGQQSTKTDSSQKPDAVKTQTQAPQADENKGEWVFAPIPVRSPAIGAGLEWAVGYVAPLNKQDKVSPPSLVGVGGLFTNNGSRGLAVGGKLYLNADKYRVALAGGQASMSDAFYGVGRAAGETQTFLPLNTKGTAFFTESLIQFRKHLYAGIRFQYRNLKLSVDRQNSDLPPDTETNPPPGLASIINAIREDLFRQRTVALGPRFQFDTRNN